MLKLALLGTGATMPLPDRALASMALTSNGHVILVDCGEGTQVAARKAKISLCHIDYICLTHFHGDHYFGLPGLLQTIGNLGRSETITIVGPEGLLDAAKSIIHLAGQLPFPVELKEIDLNAQENPIAELPDGLKISWFPLKHRIKCIGYCFELPRGRKFLKEKADSLNIPPQLRGTLQKGIVVTLQDGKVIYPDEVLGAERTGIKCVYALDTAPCESVVSFAKDADILICDATYAEDTDEKKAEEFGHCTFQQALQMAKKANAKRLLLTHFSAAIKEPADYQSQVETVFSGAVIGQDGMQIELRFDDKA